MGRFINEDPLESGSSWYSYCSNNPLKYTDSTGLDERLDTYMKQNYSGKITATLCIERAVANSRDIAAIKDGKIYNGHSFLRLDDGNGNISYTGFAPGSRSAGMLVGGYDVDGKFVDDSNTEWNVAKVFELSSDQLKGIQSYINYVKDNQTNYDIDNYNCTTFAVEALTRGAGFYRYNLSVYEHNWTVPSDAVQQFKTMYPKMPEIAIKGIVSRLKGYYGYTPSDAAQDIKSGEGNYIVHYDGVGVEEYSNTATLRSR